MSPEEHERTKFAGRRREMERVRGILKEVSEGRGRLLLIEGEAGIGKTRFVEEVLGLPEAAEFHKLTTRCVYFEEIDPYLPFNELYIQSRELMKTSGGMGGEEQGITLPWSRREGSSEPAPLSLLPLMVDEEEVTVKGEATPEGRVKFIFDLERSGPVIVFIDDVHWMDRASLNLLKYLSTRIADKSIILMATYRPEDLLMERNKTRHILETLKGLGKERITERLLLDRLEMRDVEEILKDRLRVSELPPGLLEVIYRYSGGNPFFVEELLFSLIDQRIIFPEAVDSNVVERIKEIEIPLTLSDLIGRRYESLSEDARKIVRGAAVAGLEVEFSLLKSIVDVEEEKILDALEELQLTRFMEEHRRNAEIIYRFKNSLIQEYIYRNLSLSRRRYLHNRIGMIMEKQYKNRPQYYNKIAMHYYNGENYPLAVKYYMMAADITLRRNPLEAIDYYEKALKIFEERGLSDPPLHMRIMMNLITLYLETGDAVKAEEAIKNVVSLPEGERVRREYSLKLNHRLGEFYILKNDFKKAKETLERLYMNKEILSFPEEASRLYRNLGYVYWKLGQLEKAVEMYSLSLTRAKEDKQMKYVIKLYLDIGNIMSYRGEMSRARGYYLSGLRTVEEHGIKFDRIRVYNNIADTYLREGRVKEALKESSKAVELSRKYHFKVIWPYITHLEALAMAGDEEGFKRQLKIISDELEDFDPQSSPDVKYCRAVLLRTVADKKSDEELRIKLLEKAGELLREAIGAYEERGFHYEKAISLTLLGEVLLRTGKTAEAKKVLEEARDIFNSYHNEFMKRRAEGILQGIQHQ